jgi:ABC-type sugar transport system permease subunit
MLLLSVWTFWPFFYSIYLSITDWNILKPDWNIVGLDNYVSLFKSPEFWQITRNTLMFSFGTVIVGLTLSLGLAVLLNQALVARGLWRLVIFSPHITTSAAIALVWSAMYAPRFGVFASLFDSVGLKFPNVLSDTKFVLPAIMLVAIWKGLGFSTIIFLAALQGVDRSLKEAAAIDGASTWQSFWHITFPAISPITYFLSVIGLMGAFKTFDLIAVMTGGGPANASNVYVYQIYREAFGYQRFGFSSALAVILFILLMLFTYAQTRLKNRWVNY